MIKKGIFEPLYLENSIVNIPIRKQYKAPDPQRLKEEAIYTQTEKRIHTIEVNTPEIRLLIEAFDLVDNKYNEIRKII